MLSVEVKDTGDENDHLKSISNITLLNLEPKKLEIQIDFDNPQAISEEILYPDVLQVEFKLPMLITDAETLE